MENRILMIDGCETRFVEFKREYSVNLLKTISAYANYHDGRIYIGIDNTGVIAGVQNLSQLKLNIENSINDNISPRPYFEFSSLLIDEKAILILTVYKGEFVPYYYSKRAYKRSDTSSVEVDSEELKRLVLEGRNFSLEELEAGTEELTFSYMENSFRQVKMISGMNTDIFRSLELMKNGRYTNAAALLSDRNPLKNSGVLLVKYSKEYLNIEDKLILRQTSLLKQFDQCMDFFRKHINDSEIISGAYRLSTEEIPLVAYREAVANAIIHRDYTSNGEVRVEFFTDRIEIVSPGGLPAGISEQEYLDGRISVMRNRIIADIFMRLGIIEKLATGIRKIKEYYSTYSIQPIFKIMENSITVILPKVMPHFVKEGLHGSIYTHSIGNRKHQYSDYTYSHDTLKVYEHGIYNDNYTHDNRISTEEKAIVEEIVKCNYISRKRAQELINKGKTRTAAILNTMVAKNMIFIDGTAKNTKYLLRY